MTQSGLTLDFLTNLFVETLKKWWLLFVFSVGIFEKERSNPLGHLLWNLIITPTTSVFLWRGK